MSTRRDFLRTILVCLAITSGVLAADRRITFEQQTDMLLIRVDGRPLATYVYRDPQILRPYFKDIHAPDGVQVTRRHPPKEGADPTDHATMHPGLWLAFGDLGGADFWRNKAQVEHVSFVKPPLAEGDKGSFTVRNRYVGESGVVCEETCTYTFLVRPAGYLILWDSTFQSDQPGFYFGDQEEMGLGIRVATSMMVKPYASSGHRPGRILNDEGRRDEEETWGRQAAWCDYGGWVDDDFAGLMVMPHPGNDQPCRWHTRDYGLMVANPFGQAVFKQGPARKTEIGPGECYRLRFGVLIHSNDKEDGIHLDAAYQDYLQCAEDRGGKSVRLDPKAFKHHVDFFNGMEPENIVNHVANAQSWDWMRENVPFFECPDKDFEQIYYFRWWTFRKHLKETADGFVFTEFLDRVGHSGRHNTISCALGHHIYEGTWLRDRRYIDDCAQFWYVGNGGDLQPHLHRYSNWGTWALYRRYLVNGDRAFLVSLLDAFIRDYELWEKEQSLENGLFWQYDVRDGMEESISGGRRIQNARPPLNSYLYAGATAIAKVARLAGQEAIAREYARKAERLRSLVHELLWDKKAGFFKVRHPNGELANVREEIGFIPWYFHLPFVATPSGDSSEYALTGTPRTERAWQQLVDPEGFKAPMGITTAERRHPAFRSHGVGTCEWDGAVWPHATSQTLVAMANLLRDYQQSYVSKADYFEALLTYARSHRYQGKPYIGEYLDEKTGAWLKPDSNRSRYYNHSTFCDLVISGLVGLVPREDDIVQVHPLLPSGTWDWFCLDRVSYHERMLTIVWDRTGERYGQGKGLRVFADGALIAASEELAPVEGRLP